MARSSQCYRPVVASGCFTDCTTKRGDHLLKTSFSGKGASLSLSLLCIQLDDFILLFMAALNYLLCLQFFFLMQSNSIFSKFKFPVKIINNKIFSWSKSRFVKRKTNKYCNVDGFKNVNVYLDFPYGRCSSFLCLCTTSS